MSDSDEGQEKTEDPSEKKVQDAREQGQIAKTTELSAVISIAGALLGFSFIGKSWFNSLLAGLKQAIASIETVTTLGIVALFLSWIKMALFPLLLSTGAVLGLLFFLHVASGLAQTGLLVTMKPLSPKFSNLNPAEGLSRLFSPKALMQVGKSAAKLLVIGWIIYSEIRNNLGETEGLSRLHPVEAAEWGVVFITHILMKISLFLIALAALDYGYQKHSLHKSLMMSRQELKEEIKESQVSEHVRAKVRQIQQERSKRAIRTEVPKADVVVTNPTHFAVALKYERKKDRAPRVVAKGADQLAKMIREIATKNQVPLYEAPPLARALYKDVKIGRQIPGELYEGVAKVLAYVYRVHRRSISLKGR